MAKRIQSGNINVNDALAAAYASKGTPSGGVKQSGVGARHGDQGLLKYTDAINLAVLKKQVLSAPARRALREARRADPQGAGRDAEARDPLVRSLQFDWVPSETATFPGCNCCRTSGSLVSR